MEKKWQDISQALTNDMGHWPGDTPFTYELTYSKSETGSVNLGQITTSLHTGTHVDAPFHFENQGKTIEQLDLNVFIGEALLIDVSKATTINAALLERFLTRDYKRILLKTALPNNPKQFPEAIPEIDPDIAPFLAERGIILFGIDLPSVDALDSKSLDVHHALHQNGIQILENIMLDQHEAGRYELIALPLAIHGADGSPVRAVIRKLEEE